MVTIIVIIIIIIIITNYDYCYDTRISCFCCIVVVLFFFFFFFFLMLLLFYLLFRNLSNFRVFFAYFSQTDDCAVAVWNLLNRENGDSRPQCFILKVLTLSAYLRTLLTHAPKSSRIEIEKLRVWYSETYTTFYG